jgi:membrane associated rhomboid family serine protease
VFRFPPLTPAVRALLIALLSLFVVEAVLQNFLGVPVFEWLALHTRTVSPATAWQLFTHVLVVPPVPGSVFALALSLVFIWLILAPFEARYGQDRVVQLTIVSALGAGLPALIVGQVAPQMAGDLAGPGSITLAAIAAYAAILPAHTEVSFFGVLPMRSQHLIFIVIALSVLGFLTTRDAAQLAADLGAIATGVGFCKLWMQRPSRPNKPRRSPPRGSTRLRAVPSEDVKSSKRWLN